MPRFVSQLKSPDLRSALCWLVAALVVSVAAGCGDQASTAQPANDPTATAGTPEPAWSLTAGESVSCSEGRLEIQDVLDADTSLAEGLVQTTETARAWQPDARLIELRLGCPLLEPGLQWQGTFFSDTAQAFFLTATGETEPAEVDPQVVPTLNVEGISFTVLHDALIEAGFDETATLSPEGGVTLRRSTDAFRFGPPTAPTEQIYFYVAIEDRGEVRDVWIAAEDGRLFEYEME